MVFKQQRPKSQNNCISTLPILFLCTTLIASYQLRLFLRVEGQVLNVDMFEVSSSFSSTYPPSSLGCSPCPIFAPASSRRQKQWKTSPSPECPEEIGSRRSFSSRSLTITKLMTLLVLVLLLVMLLFILPLPKKPSKLNQKYPAKGRHSISCRVRVRDSSTYHKNVMRQVSGVTCHMSLRPTATATDPPPANSPTMHSRMLLLIMTQIPQQ